MFEEPLSMSSILASALCWRLFTVIVSTPLANLCARHHTNTPAPVEKNKLDERVRTLSRYGPSYITSFVHSCLTGTLGLLNVLALWHAPLHLQTEVKDASVDVSRLDPSEAGYVAAGRGCLFTARIIFGYLLNDSLDLFMHYPKLGGADIVIHHLIFMLCCATAGYFNLFPFAFAWLVCGEASTPFLNLRWYLIQSGRGEGWAMAVTIWMFGAVFFSTRVALYWYGMSMLGWRHAIEELGKPSWAVWTITVIIVAGAMLNLVWFAHIVPLCLRGGKPKKRHAKEA